MIEEKDIRAIYEGFYNLFEKVGIQECTLGWSRIVLPVMNDIGETLSAGYREEESRALGEVIKRLNEEYLQKIKELAFKHQKNSLGAIAE